MQSTLWQSICKVTRVIIIIWMVSQSRSRYNYQFSSCTQLVSLQNNSSSKQKLLYDVPCSFILSHNTYHVIQYPQNHLYEIIQDYNSPEGEDTEFIYCIHMNLWYLILISTTGWNIFYQLRITSTAYSPRIKLILNKSAHASKLQTQLS